MQRKLLHILFWVFYLTQDTLLAYLWDATMMKDFGVNERILVAFELCAALLPPKIIFTYLVLYFFLPRMLRQDRQLLPTAAFSIATMVISIFTIRLIEVYFVYPVILSRLGLSPSYFSPFGFLFTFIDLGYVSGIAIAIKQFHLQLQAKEREKLLIKEKLGTELKFLRNQTNPHFLFNTLNTIYGLARKKSNDTAEVVMRLSKLLRFMIYETKNAFIKTGDEIRMLENYINLEQIRYTRKLTVEFNKQIDDENEPITPLLLMPFLENAFKHGVGENRFESFIHINMVLEKGNMLFEIENSKETDNPGEIVESVGLSNVKRQLELMYKDYQLDVRNEAALFRVTLNVNLRSYANL